MAKWAKSMNAQKESATLKQRYAANTAAAHARKESAAADAGFAMLEKVAQVHRNPTLNIAHQQLLRTTTCTMLDILVFRCCSTF